MSCPAPSSESADVKLLGARRMISHYYACIFFWIGEMNKDDVPRSPTWTTTETDFVAFGHPLGTSVSDMAPNIQAQYIISLYWSFTTLTTVGYGDITPVTLSEVIFATWVIVNGGFMLGYVVGSLANLISRIDMRKKRHLEKVVARA